MYPIMACVGTYIGLKWIGGASSLHEIGAWIVIIGLTLIGLYIGYSTAQVIKVAPFTVTPIENLFEIYETYYNFFYNSGSTGGAEKRYSGFNSRINFSDDVGSAQREGNPYYDILGQATTLDELKKQYRKLAMENHPDLHPEADSTIKMAQINEAFENL